MSSAALAVADIHSGASLVSGGFGVCGIPSVLIEALVEAEVGDLEVVSNNCGVDDWGLGRLLSAGRIAGWWPRTSERTRSSRVSTSAVSSRVELTPQGSLAERLRAGGSGIPAFYTATGVGTQVAEGGLPWKYDVHGNVEIASPAKEVRRFNGSEYVLEQAIVCDFALVRAWKGDRHGNLVFNQAARNFNPLAAMAGRITIAEVEQLVDPGELEPDQVHTPGVFVHRVVALTSEQAADNRIEKRTVRR